MPRIAISSVSGDLTKRGRYIRRLFARESAGTPAAFKWILRDGSAGGAIVMVIQGAASGTFDSGMIDPPILVPLGFYLTNSAGTWDGFIDGY